MTDDNTADAGEQVEQTEQQDEGFKAPASQEELDRIIQKRIERERKRFEDYDDLKASAGKVESLEAENAELRKQVESFTARDARTALVRKVADAESVDADLLAEMRGDSEEELTAQAQRLADRIKPSQVIPGQAKTPDAGPTDEARAFMRRILQKDA